MSGAARPGKKRPSRTYLDELTRTHQIRIPFENLDVTDFQLPVGIEPGRLMDKLLRGKRGGYCFELNGLFFLLLTSLGFDSWMCPCRQLRHPEVCPVPATHCGVLVYLDGKSLFCDVGYGGPAPRGSMELRAGVGRLWDGRRSVSGKAASLPQTAGPAAENPAGTLWSARVPEACPAKCL